MLDYTGLLEELNESDYIDKNSLLGLIMVLNQKLIDANDTEIQSLHIKLETLYELIAFDQEYKSTLPL